MNRLTDQQLDMLYELAIDECITVKEDTAKELQELIAILISMYETLKMNDSEPEEIIYP